MRERIESVARELKHGILRVESGELRVESGELRVESGEAKRLRTRAVVRRAWMAVTDTLTRGTHPDIAAQVRRHVERMPPPLTEKEFRVSPSSAPL